MLNEKKRKKKTRHKPHDFPNMSCFSATEIDGSWLVRSKQRNEWQDTGHEGGCSQGNKRAPSTWCRHKEDKVKRN